MLSVSCCRCRDVGNRRFANGMPPLKWSSLSMVLTMEDGSNGKEETYG